MAGVAVPPRGLPGEVGQRRCRVWMLPPPARPGDWPIVHALLRQGRQVRLVHVAFSDAHAFGAVLPSAASPRGSDADVESGGSAWSCCRCQDIGRAEARSSSKQAKDLLLSGGVSESGQVEDAVANIVVPSGAFPWRAAEGVPPIGPKYALAAAATQGHRGEACPKTQAAGCNIGIRLDSARTSRIDCPEPFRRNAGVAEIGKPDLLFLSLCGKTVAQAPEALLVVDAREGVLQAWPARFLRRGVLLVFAPKVAQQGAASVASAHWRARPLEWIPSQ